MGKLFHLIPFSYLTYKIDNTIIYFIGLLVDYEL